MMPHPFLIPNSPDPWANVVTYWGQVSLVALLFIWLIILLSLPSVSWHLLRRRTASASGRRFARDRAPLYAHSDYDEEAHEHQRPWETTDTFATTLFPERHPEFEQQIRSPWRRGDRLPKTSERQTVKQRYQQPLNPPPRESTVLESRILPGPADKDS